MDTDSFIIHIKTKDVYNDIADDVGNRFDTSSYAIKRPLPTGKNKKIIGLMKDESGGNTMTVFVALRPKTYFYLTKDGNSDKKAKGTNKCVTKQILKFNDYKKCLLNNKMIVKLLQRYKRIGYKCLLMKLNKIALSSNDDKRLQTCKL